MLYLKSILIRKLAAAYGAPSNGTLTEVIKEVPNCGCVDDLRKGNWISLKKIRDNLFHQERIPTDAKIDRLIKEVLLLEKDLKSAAASMG